MVWRGRGSWNDPPTVRGQRLVASIPGAADRFPIAGPPGEKLAVRYAQAHFSRPRRTVFITPAGVTSPRDES